MKFLSLYNLFQYFKSLLCKKQQKIKTLKKVLFFTKVSVKPKIEAITLEVFSKASNLT